MTNESKKSMRIFSCDGVAAIWYAVTTVTLICLSGCDAIDKMGDDRPQAVPAQIVDAPGNAKTPTPSSGNPPAANPPVANNPPANAEPAANQPANPTPVARDPATDPNSQKVDATVGAQGKGYDNNVISSPITTPVGEYFTARAGIDFMMVEHDMQIWHEIHQRYPRNLDEFKKEILEPGNRELPDLFPGDVYVYDAKTGQLYVQHNPPKK
ncbi:MAG TPA: hypothetical protein VGI75_02950 [Pirellulales bacterium]|jgi:hypothetical protein